MPASIILLEFSLHLNNDFACEPTAIDFVTHPIRFRNSISGVDGNDEMNDCPIDTRLSTQPWTLRTSFNQYLALLIGFPPKADMIEYLMTSIPA